MASIPTLPCQGFSSSHCNAIFVLVDVKEEGGRKKTTLVIWCCSSVLTGPFTNVSYKPSNQDVNQETDSFIHF